MSQREPGFPMGWEQMGGTPASEAPPDGPRISPLKEAPGSAITPLGKEVFPDEDTQGVLWNEIYSKFGPVLEKPVEIWFKSMKHAQTGQIKLVDMYVGSSTQTPGYWILVFCEKRGGRLQPIVGGAVKDEVLARHRIGLRLWPKADAPK